MKEQQLTHWRPKQGNTAMHTWRDWNHLVMWERDDQGLMGQLMTDNVDQVCCHCRPGEVDGWAATPAETPKEDSQKTQIHTKLQHKPQTTTLFPVSHFPRLSQSIYSYTHSIIISYVMYVCMIFRFDLSSACE